MSSHDTRILWAGDVEEFAEHLTTDPTAAANYLFRLLGFHRIARRDVDQDIAVGIAIGHWRRPDRT